MTEDASDSHTMSIGMSISFIQIECRAFVGNSNNIPSVGASAGVPLSPRSRSPCAFATRTVNMPSPIFMRTIFLVSFCKIKERRTAVMTNKSIIFTRIELYYYYTDVSHAQKENIVTSCRVACDFACCVRRGGCLCVVEARGNLPLLRIAVSHANTIRVRRR